MTAAELAQILTEAVTAMRALLATTGADGWEDHADAATKAVTAAVLTDGISHRQIASLAGCDGITVIRHIADPDAAGDALRVERHHAERYQRQVLRAMREYAMGVLGGQDGRGKSELSQRLGVSRPTIDTWWDSRTDDAAVEAAEQA